PRRGSRLARTPAHHSLGGGPGRFGLDRHPRRHRHGEGPGRLVQPPPVAAQGSWASEQTRQAGELLRRAADPRARDPHRRRATALRGAREGVQLRREEQTMTAVTHFALARPYRLSLDSYAQVT